MTSNVENNTNNCNRTTNNNIEFKHTDFGFDLDQKPFIADNRKASVFTDFCKNENVLEASTATTSTASIYTPGLTASIYPSTANGASPYFYSTQFSNAAAAAAAAAAVTATGNMYSKLKTCIKLLNLF